MTKLRDPDAAELLAARPALAMHAMDGLLLDGIPLASVARSFGTPSWVYGADTIRARLRRLTRAMPGIAIHYAAKALDHLSILELVANEGAGADVVSGGELLRAREAGIPAARIVFSGVGKTRWELRMALDHGIGQINVESAEELAELSVIAAGCGRQARVALRVNPDVAADTHDKIATGRAGDKFGIPFGNAVALYASAAALPGILPVGLAVHIGSQLHDMAAFRAAYARVAVLVEALLRAGLPVETVDCGGGLGIAYRDEIEAVPEAWAGAIRNAFGRFRLRLAIEPGRWLTAPAGVLLSSVIRTRRAGMDRPIVILDAAMNELARPSLYGAWHGVVPVSAQDFGRAPELSDIAGPVCESSDFLARGRLLAPLDAGALVAILDAGAYGASMSSTYNARPRAAEILVEAGVAHLVTPRQDHSGLWRHEMLPLRTSAAA